jgi:uncharacterized protein
MAGSDPKHTSLDWARIKIWMAPTFGLALVTALILGHANQFGEWFLGLSPLESRDLFWWPMLFLTLGYIRGVEKRSLRSIGFRRPSWVTFVGAAVLVLIAHYPQNWLAEEIVNYLHLADSDAGNSTGSAIDTSPLWYKVLLLTRAAFAEEVIFRGYLIERMEDLTGSRILACLASVALFTYAHLALWGLTSLVYVVIAGLLLTIAYQWRRDLWMTIIAHWLIDAWVVLL